MARPISQSVIRRCAFCTQLVQNSAVCLLSQFWCSRSLKSHFQEVVVYRIALPN